jgi:hypothetical protein
LGARNYYYFVATLPFVEYGDKPPVSSEEFRELCHGLLHPDDAALTQYCYYDPRITVETVQPTGSGFIDLLMARERTLVLNLAFLRAAKLKRPSPGDPPHDVPRAEAVAKAAFEMDDPLEAAITIDKARWGALNDMVGIDLFGVNNIFAYLMKLQLLERRQCFDAEIGAVKYKERYDSILNEYNSKV